MTFHRLSIRGFERGGAGVALRGRRLRAKWTGHRIWSCRAWQKRPEDWQEIPLSGTPLNCQYDSRD